MKLASILEPRFIKVKSRVETKDKAIHLLLDNFLDPGGMNAPVGDESFQRDARNFAANRVVAGDNDRLRRIVLRW